MNMYSPGNAAKQWILEQIETAFKNRECKILDLACGEGWIWEKFCEANPHVFVTGVDTDVDAIRRGNGKIPSHIKIELSLFDAQKPFTQNDFDVVTALSAIEHVVDRVAFVKTVWNALRPGGIAFLNYDVGHFRSRNIKERLMVPVSQVLARFGVEGPYMKRVDDSAFIRQLEGQGFFIVRHMKHNAAGLKKAMKKGGNEAVRLWIDFETQLNDVMSPSQLDALMYSTTIVVRKP